MVVGLGLGLEDVGAGGDGDEAAVRGGGGRRRRRREGNAVVPVLALGSPEHSAAHGLQASPFIQGRSPFSLHLHAWL